MDTQCTVSGTNFVYSFSLLRNWVMQSYSATISCSRIISWVPHGVLTPKGFNVYNKIHIKFYFARLETHFSQNVLLQHCSSLLWLTVCLILNMFDYVLTSINDIPYFQDGIKTHKAQPVSDLRAKL